ncbi:MAG: amidohydrolase family protein [Deltaproteobacteria bacterium]|jgi:imidazolonepropionase-like amidohydrolase|nr:amidohydrolase family protein [Deltaproteobacteria bacterium]MBW2449721.1 amidohydrolase family protein [Deltaproteobacteria bacterium]
MNSIFANTIYTGKSIVSERYLIFKGTDITGLAKSAKGQVLGRYDALTPAFIDPHSHIGMERSGEPIGEGEANDHLDSILALTDALDSVQMDDKAFRDAVESGVLYSCVVPGSGNIIGGQSAVIRNYANDSTAALIARAGLKAAFGYNPMSTRSWQGKRPNTRMGAIAILRGRLEEVRRKTKKFRKAKGSKKEEITFSAEDTVLQDLLAGKFRLRAHVHKIDDIAALLRLVDDYKLKLTVEHASDVYQSEIFRELRKRNIPVVYGPVDSFSYKVELKHEDWRNIRHLLASQVEFGLMTDHPITLARQLFLQTRWFMRAGLTKQQAIELVSRKNARILGIDDRLGILEKGKWASFICWSGDPFDLASYPAAVYGEGELLFSE